MTHSAKIAVTIDANLLSRLDALVKNHFFKNRSQAIQMAVQRSVEKAEHKRLAEECGKLDLDFERSLAEENLPKDMDEWPQF